MSAVLRRMTGLDAFDLDAEAQPPDGELAEAKQRMGTGEGHAVIGADRSRQTKLLEGALEHHEGIGFLGGCQRLAADEVATGEVTDGEQVRRTILDIADTSANVVINGETGTGKELVARSLHEHSSRRNAQFVAINCSGVPEQLFESEIFGHELGAFTGENKRPIGKVEWANGGTMFLDEIESLPMSLQVKLLRVLQERKIERLGSNELIPVDCRVIAASQEDLGELVKQQPFRSNLYYRLNVAVIELPPLRERRER